MKLTFVELAPNNINVDHQYQRPLTDAHVNRIGREYNREYFGVIVVSKREDGRHYVIDGQHRLAAMIKIGKGDIKVPCMVYEGLTVGQEADMFVSQTKSRNIHPIDLYRARMFAGEPKILEINQIVEEAGLVVKNDNHAATIRAPHAVEMIYDAGGKDHLKTVLDIVYEVWGEDRRGIQAGIVRGVDVFIRRYDKLYDRNRFVTILQTTSRPKIDGMARSMGEFINERAFTLYARAFVTLYNGKLRSGRLPEWSGNLTEAEDSEVKDGPRAVESLPDVRQATA
jgi:hypothetical protein